MKIPYEKNFKDLVDEELFLKQKLGQGNCFVLNTYLIKAKL